jgi:hypothetical protein
VIIPRFSKEEAAAVVDQAIDKADFDLVAELELHLDPEYLDHYQSQPSLFLEGCVSTLLTIEAVLHEVTKRRQAAKRTGKKLPSTVSAKTVLDNMKACALVVAKELSQRDV